ncbi:Peptidase M28 domain-containing protein [Rozella allomycis CSF55]|uniref:Peptide hydrolase n=1 Tax=Rozella allomycis (strain CSF55) TaxID=988480 RepID=A0A075ASH9_ROZAC|nr:Peptidase M28 domain-containing protein [Rozella allomycis CSF55]|eukprot:EPZ33095.1 Peptidase M28 domain-containing protein [Rozella allomycis CSF55]
MTIQVEVKKYRAHLILALFLGFIFALVVCLRDRLPTALSKEEADMNDEFSGILAYEDLKFIASDFHHVGSEHNLAVFLFIQEKLLHLSSEAKKLGLSMTVMYNKQPKLTPDNEDESEIPGQIFGLLEGQTKDTIMISAHYDSVEKSFGASDNGAGVTVALEVMRKVIRGGKKPKKSLMIFLNNGEEIGLRGSKWMVNQTVYERVTRVINLEGGGTGGRAILFRTNSFSMAAAYAQVAPYPHMNIFGEIVMQRLGSYTDYEVYAAKMGKMGSTWEARECVDIAFYEGRIHYHTENDSLENISSGSVQHMGSNVYKFTKHLIFEEGTVSNESDPKNLTYYDFLGDTAAVYAVEVKTTLALVFGCLSLSLVGVLWKKTKFGFGKYIIYLTLCVLFPIFSLLSTFLFNIHSYSAVNATIGHKVTWTYHWGSFVGMILFVLFIKLCIEIYRSKKIKEEISWNDHESAVIAALLTFSAIISMATNLLIENGLVYLTCNFNIALFSGTLFYFMPKIYHVSPLESYTLMSYSLTCVALIDMAITLQRVFTMPFLFMAPLLVTWLFHTFSFMPLIPYLLGLKHTRRFMYSLLGLHVIMILVTLFSL